MNDVKRTAHNLLGNIFICFLAKLDENSTVGGYTSNQNNDWKEGEHAGLAKSLHLSEIARQPVEIVFVPIEDSRYKIGIKCELVGINLIIAKFNVTFKMSP